MLVKAELHEPPVAVSLRVIEDPAQTLATPVTAPAFGVGATVIIVQAKSVPHELDTE